MKKILPILALSLMPIVSFAAFEEVRVPTAVYTVSCGTNSRIVVKFEGDTPTGIWSIWYPGDLGAASNQFLSLATAAQVSKQALYFYGFGDATLTSVCVTSLPARKVDVIGIVR